MKRIYIAGQITGLPEEVWMKNFSLARQEVRALEAAPVCPTMQPHIHGKTWLEYMKEDLRMMLTCDAVYVQRNWKNSKGAVLEWSTATALNMEIIYQPELKEVDNG